MPDRKIKNNEIFVKLWNRGISEKKIAQTFGVSLSYVCWYRKHLGLQPRPRGHPGNAPSEQEIIKFVEKRGISTIKDVTENFGCSYPYISTFLRLLKRNGQLASFWLKIGGHTKTKNSDLFGCQKGMDIIYYYVDEDKTVEFLVKKLGLNVNIPQQRRRNLTHFLKRCTSPSLFKKLYRYYNYTYP